MPLLNPSPPPTTTTEKLKTASSPASKPLPLSTRAFRAVKDAVLGRRVPVPVKDEIASSQSGLSTTEVCEMPRLRSGMSMGERSSPVGAGTPVRGKPKRGVLVEGEGEEEEEAEGADTPSRKSVRLNGTSLAGKRKRDVLAEKSDGTDEKGAETPSRNSVKLNGISLAGKRKRDVLSEEPDGVDEEGADTPSRKSVKLNGTSSAGKRRSLRTNTQLKTGLEGKEANEDPVRTTTPQRPKRNALIDANEQMVETESTLNGSGPSDGLSLRRRRPPDEALDKGSPTETSKTPRFTPAKRRTRLKPLQGRKAQRLSGEEADLGFRAIGTPKPAKIAVEEVSGSHSVFDEEPSDVDRGETPTSNIDESVSKATVTTFPTEQDATLQIDDLSADTLGLDDAIKSLRKVLDNMSPKSMAQFKSGILAGLTGKRPLPLANLESEYMKVHQLVEQTVLAGEGNSMLLIGSRGSAKTSLVEKVLSDLSADHRENFHVVRLNGFIHTDDKLALREIWRQLGREMEIEDDAATGKSNYADVLAMLLALLSHPAEEELDAKAPSTAKSVIFIIDEFDLFASHPRQTLLYNLFDVAQSRNAPIAVLGLTTKIDVVESLEKRVKSRFGQRYVYMSLPRTFLAFQTICNAVLIPPKLDLASYTKYKGAQSRAITTPIQNLHAAWTTYINALFADTNFAAYLRNIYATTKSVPCFMSSCLLPISTLSPSNIPTAYSFLSASSSLQPPDSKLHLLPSLSELALSLLIAAARLDIILSTDLCNFEMVYEEYVNLASRIKMQTTASGQLAVGGGGGGRVWGRAVAKGEWERLIDLQLVVPATGGMAVGRQKGEQGRMWKVDVGLEEIGGSVKMSAVMARWCREI